jgi:catechol 2,3-dioxygenase-like lactoylglutathione lyase family enzyme
MIPKATFRAGRNIAMKVPSHLYDVTVHFYRDVLGLHEIAVHSPSVVFEFGSNQLWIDSVAGISQAETWLEVLTDDIDAASEHLRAAGIVRCDSIEPLPDGFQAFWISSPASIIHLVCKDSQAW